MCAWGWVCSNCRIISRASSISAEIDERHGCRAIAARQLRQCQDGASCPRERGFRMPSVAVANGES
jgi:hypothetical protein